MYTIYTHIYKGPVNNIGHTMYVLPCIVMDLTGNDDAHKSSPFEYRRIAHHHSLNTNPESSTRKRFRREPEGEKFQ